MKTTGRLFCYLIISIVQSLILFLFYSLSFATPSSVGSKEVLHSCVSQDWWSRIQADINKSEYNVTWQNKTDIPDVTSAWQATNRANNLHVNFLDYGIRVIPNDAIDIKWVWCLALKGYRTENTIMEVRPVIPEVNKNRIVYKRGPLEEWYINNEKGIEQGFTLFTPPDGGKTQSSLTVITMKINSDLNCRLNRRFSDGVCCS
jgi:hypothetical protein